MPEIVLTGTLPYYSKSYNMFQNSDGTYTYVSNNYNTVNAGLKISQNIPWTGGKVTVQSNFERLHQNGQTYPNRYKTVPISGTLEQPLFGFNRVKWSQRIEPIAFEKAQKKLISDKEDVILQIIDLYFNFFLGKINLDIAQQNKANAERLYAIAEARFEMGQLSEVELLQMKNSLLSAISSLTDMKASLDSRMFRLCSFLGLEEGVVIEPVTPEFDYENLPQLDYQEVLRLAQKNNYFTQNIQRRILEASRSVSQARSDRWNVTLYASFGYSARENTFNQAFNSNNWRDDQVINVGISVPILDWGKGKAKLKVAESNKEVVQSRIEKEKIDFNQNIFLYVNYFNNQPGQLRLAKEMDEIAAKRYATTVEAFVHGQMDILNLNDAQSNKDSARRKYIEEMFLIWSYYYQIRSLTLYDFIADSPIDIEYPIQ